MYIVFFHPSLSSLHTAYILYLFLLPNFLPLFPCFLPLFSYSSVLVFVPLTSIVIPQSSAQAGSMVVKVSGHVQRHSGVGGARNQLKVIERGRRSYWYDRTSFRSEGEVRGVIPHFQYTTSGNF
jgi:hypothetical protein